MTTVLVLSNCPPKLRGDMTKWFIEVNCGVYVGSINKRVREALWRRVCDNLKGGQATMVFHADNEQQLDFYVHNTTWEPIDFDGIKLMRRPSPERLASRSESILKPGFSNAARCKYQRRSAVTKCETYVVIDLETTGLNTQSDLIIEYAAIKVDKGQIIEEFSVLVKRDLTLPNEIVELTGITSELMSNEGLDPADALCKFLEFIGRLRIVGHNLDFDMPFIISECKRYSISPPCGKCEDTLRLAHRKISGTDNYKLLTLAKHFMIPTGGAHRALSDCKILHEVYLKLKQL
ncbi:MAG TPA: type I-E CRISPR-associated endoribonuclease Cas2e [Firmicutes bacterium]|nr:type I-E CRISPR-associated endoribonuclease Cas2e [Bacillota bacterium]